MKKLWKHMANCKNPKCTEPHCISSRYVLSHYRKCKKDCEVCSPVRQAIDRHNRRLSALQAAESFRNGTAKRPRPRGAAAQVAAAGRGANNNKRARTMPGTGLQTRGSHVSRAPVDTKASVCCTMNREELLYHIRSLRRGFNAVHSPQAIKVRSWSRRAGPADVRVKVVVVACCVRGTPLVRRW